MVGDEGLVLHFDGLRWQRMPSGTKSALYSLWAWDDQRMLAPGDFGLMLRYNDKEWTEFNVGSESFLYGVWGDSLDNIYTVGLSGTLALWHTLMASAGSTWPLVYVKIY